MAKQEEGVETFMAELDHPLKAEIEAVRAIILGANPQITEHIKWKGPSFCYAGDDRVTFRLHPKDRIQLVFHRGAKVREDSQDFVFEDSAGLLEWVTADRATVTFQDMQDVKAKKAALAEVVDRWVKATT